MADHLVADQLYIDGRFVDGAGASLDVEDPATESVFTSVPTADAGQIDEAIAAAHRAFEQGDWARMPGAERVAALGALANALVARRDELVETAVRETGSPLMLAHWAQVGMALDQARQLPELFATLPEWEHNELPLDAHLGPAGGDVMMSI